VARITFGGGLHAQAADWVLQLAATIAALALSTGRP
jgi:hypothetical protein